MHAGIRYHRIAVAFGFVLYKMQTDPNNRVLINQIPNVWVIRNVTDEDGGIRDIQQTDLFDLLRIRMTNMVVYVFPI